MVTYDMKENAYFQWLMDIIGGPREYEDVIIELWETEYLSDIPHDENRASDGIELRYHFEVETGKKCEKTGPCTVLEMMIGLANRMENAFMYDPKVGNRTGQWFWEMFFNAGLEKLVGRGQKKWASAHFCGGKSGRLDLFKMTKKPENWDKMEVWEQLCRYISRKFGEY